MQIKLELPQLVNDFVDKFLKNGNHVYIVGGASRDLITNRKVHDWDFTTELIPEEILKLFPTNSFYNNDFGTVRVILGEDIFEVTTFRTEAEYKDGRRPKNIFWGSSIEEDLERRDFTINAIALNVVGENQVDVIDPFGGLRDLKNKVLKAVGKPDARFEEDALRLMRAIRIASQLHFAIENETLLAIKKNAKLLKKISGERVRDELLKILASPKPEIGILVLKETGLLKEIIPELLEGEKMEQKGHHIYDVWTHSLKALGACESEDVITRLSTLLHDVGKPRSLKISSGERTFHNHEVIGSRMAVDIGKRLRLSNKELDQLFRLVRWHMFTVEENQTDSAVRRFIRNVKPELVDEMIALRKADRIGSGAKATSWRWELFKERIKEVSTQPFSIKDLKINGNDVMEVLKIKPGRKVGEILKNIFVEVEITPSLNTREVLLEKLEKYR